MTWAGSAGNMLDWAAAGRAHAGEVVSGDVHVVAPFSGGALVAVIDGLGHGPEAQVATRAAVEVLLEDPQGAVETLVARCHRALGRFRGAVMSLASFDAARASMTWLGIGNVEGALFRHTRAKGHAARERLLLWGGIVGQMLPKLRPTTLPVVSGDTLVLATDGVHGAAIDGVRTSDAVEALAAGMIAKHAKGTDDALVLVARYRGKTP